MTTTAPTRPLSADGRGRLPAPVRDRRPALAALALLLVLGGALTSALIAYRSGDRVDVLVAREDIEVGQIMSAADFSVARVAADGAASIPADAIQNFVGTSASGRVPAGTMLNRSMFLAVQTVQPLRTVQVGVVLGANQYPPGGVRAGDVVRVFLVPRDAGGAVQGSVLLDAVRVASVEQSVGGEGIRVSLLVPEGPATPVVIAAATGSIAITLLAPETLPSVDFRTE